VAVTLHDVHTALHGLGKLRFGEMRVEDAMSEIVQSTHTIFDVDGAGLMLADAEHHLRNVAVSDARLGHLEELQIKHQEGPCGFAAKIAILWTIGIIALVVGLILLLLGSIGHAVGGRRHYF
jgi:hypothetical protein